MRTLLRRGWGGVSALARQAGRGLADAGGSALARRWAPFSRLFLVSDAPQWVIAWELREVAAIARRLGVRVADACWLRCARNQAVFYGSHFVLLDWHATTHRVGIAYFHGRPGTGVPAFDESYRRLCQAHLEIDRVQVSHTEMREVVLESGIASEKVFLIPIAVNLSYFSVQTPQRRRQARTRLEIPQTAVVVGSFQKDGVGWGDGNEPKLVKGPDIFLRTIELLKPRVPEIFVLLSGPARGYVKAGLERLRVPYRHIYVEYYPAVGELFQALDIYVVASREEGGPKAVLEAMASGVPLVTTRVGQAMDLVRHGENGWMVDVEDAEGLADWSAYALMNRSGLGAVLQEGRRTAEANSYEAQLPLWNAFMRGFVDLADR